MCLKEVDFFVNFFYTWSANFSFSEHPSRYKETTIYHGIVIVTFFTHVNPRTAPICVIEKPMSSANINGALFGKFLMLNHLIYCPVPFVLPLIEEETNRCMVLR
jgi:hypothetical protein